MQTTPRTLSSTCTQRKARACLTAGRMCLDICSRYRGRLRPDPLLVRSICGTLNKILSLGWNAKSIWQKLCHQNGDQVCSMADWQTERMLQTRWGQGLIKTQKCCKKYTQTSFTPCANAYFSSQTYRSYLCQLSRFCLRVRHEEEIFGLSASGRA